MDVFGSANKSLVPQYVVHNNIKSIVETLIILSPINAVTHLAAHISVIVSACTIKSACINKYELFNLSLLHDKGNKRRQQVEETNLKTTFY